MRRFNWLFDRSLLVVAVLGFASVQKSEAQTNSILPTDVVPLAGPQERGFMSDNFEITLLNRLPSRFYLNGSCESSFRLETNPFQFPSRRDVTQEVTGGQPISSLNFAQFQELGSQLSEVNKSQQIFRTLPNVTTGWTLTPTTRFYGNYFALSDTALQTTALNSVVQSYGVGVQQDIPLTSKINLQADFQGRELVQSKQVPVFDFLPSLTLSYAPTARTVLFASSVLQLRGRRPFVSPTREIDPFYSFGAVYRRGLWTFSTFATFVQNFRQPFGTAALVPVNNYSWVLDFEIARPLLKRIPSLQAFVRAEPVFNMHSKATPGFSGNDFRLFYGLRMSFGKPSLLPINQLVRQQLNEVTRAKRLQQQKQNNQPAPQGQNPQGNQSPSQKNTAPSETSPDTTPTDPRAPQGKQKTSPDARIEMQKAPQTCLKDGADTGTRAICEEVLDVAQTVPSSNGQKEFTVDEAYSTSLKERPAMQKTDIRIKSRYQKDTCGILQEERDMTVDEAQTMSLNDSAGTAGEEICQKVSLLGRN
jgi:hypothetical protein